jgi:hypothetical protein
VVARPVDSLALVASLAAQAALQAVSRALVRRVRVLKKSTERRTLNGSFVKSGRCVDLLPYLNQSRFS